LEKPREAYLRQPLCNLWLLRDRWVTILPCRGGIACGAGGHAWVRRMGGRGARVTKKGE
jgi:hypothetical protein